MKNSNSSSSARRFSTILGNAFNLLFVIAFICLLFYCLGVQPWLGTASEQSIHTCISFACGGMLMMAIYNSALRLSSRREKAALFFSLFCVGQSVRFFFMPGSVGMALFPDLPPLVVLFGLRYIPYCVAVVGLLLFIYEVYGEGRSKKLKYLAIGLLIAINLIVPIAGLDFTVWRLILGLPTALLVNGTFLFVLLKSPLLKTDRLSRLYLFGFIMYIFSWISTVTATETGPVLAVAFNFLFAVIHVVLISNRFARAIEEVEEANIRLEDRVAERTAELQTANESLAASEKNIRDMARTLSHEIRTPLTVMSTYAQLAVRQHRQGQLDEQTVEGLAAISEEAQRLAEYASSALAPRGEAERPINIAEIATQLARLFEPTMRKDGRSLNVDLPKHLLVYGNVSEITQVLWNLMDNAVKHAGEGDIDISGNANREFAYIIVYDYGKGISPDISERLFERGVSGGAGMGLGLAISTEIIARHGGRLLIEGEPGMGTKATVLLPVYRWEEEARDA